MYTKLIQKIAESQGYNYVGNLHNGLANVIAKLEKDNKFFVLKYYPKDNFKKEREAKFINIAKDFIPVPKIKSQANDFLIFDYIDGISAAHIFSIEKNKTKSFLIGQKIGEKINDLHSIKLDSEYVGFLAKDFLSANEYLLSKSTFDKNSDFLRCLIKEQEDKLSEYEIDLPDFSNLEINIKHDNQKCLIHHDICPKNILFLEDEANALLDFEYAMIGSPLFDIAKVYILGIYLAYHTLGSSLYLDFEKYINGFFDAYGHSFEYQELRPFFIYILLNYTLFWLASDLLSTEDKNRILPIHLDNLQKLSNNQEIIVPKYKK